MKIKPWEYCVIRVDALMGIHRSGYSPARVRRQAFMQAAMLAKTGVQWVRTGTQKHRKGNIHLFDLALIFTHKPGRTLVNVKF